MTERPILFSGPMVRAILEGRKTQTRRLVKPQPTLMQQGWHWICKKLDAGYCHTDRDALVRLMEPRSPYGVPGDRLWVRETLWRNGGYVATDKMNLTANEGKIPAIFMPRAACRLVLELTAVRVERLQEISGADCRAEGIRPRAFSLFGMDTPERDKIHQIEYQFLWDSLNAKRAPWASNPWVWVVSFKVVR